MNTLNVINEKITQFDGHEMHRYLMSIYSHLSMAEKHYTEGVNGGDNSLFNDVIYRCNQAFEGILREAYGLYSGKDKTALSTHDIEEYFEKNNILRSRVVDLFRNYRKEWRNPATHNYWLTFDASESFVSILSIQAFVAILLDQIIQKYYFETKKALPPTILVRDMPKSVVYTFVSVYEALLPNIVEHRKGSNRLKKVGEFIGELATIAKDLKILPDYVVTNKKGERIGEFDLLMESKNNKVPVEIYGAPSAFGSLIRSYEDRFVLKLLKSGFHAGILCYFPIEHASKAFHVKKQIDVAEKTVELHIVFPDHSILQSAYSGQIKVGIT